MENLCCVQSQEPPQTYFLFPQLQPSVFCHLSLKEMSHADRRIFWNLLDPVYLPLAYRASLARCWWDLTEQSYLSVPRRGYQLWPTSGIRTSDLTQTGGKRGV